MKRLGGFWGRAKGRGELEDTDPVTQIAESGVEWAAGASHVGQVRDNNEDSYLCDPERGLFVVADGMGGHVAGETASAIAVETIDRHFSSGMEALDAGETEARDYVLAALTAAHNAIRAAAEENPELTGMGSTVVVAILRGSTLLIANVGDSRAYMIREVNPTVVSRDHSVAAMLVERGEIPAESIRTHPLRNQLTSCLGSDRGIEPDYAALKAEPGDRLLLCSDGLWDMISDHEIAGLMSDESDARTVAADLVSAANSAGGHDNITAIAVIIGQDRFEDTEQPIENMIDMAEGVG